MFSNVLKKDEKIFILIFWKRRKQFWQLCLETFNQKFEISPLTSNFEYKVSFLSKKFLLEMFLREHRF